MEYWNVTVCLEKSVSKNSYHMQTSQLISLAKQLTGFYIIWFFTALQGISEEAITVQLAAFVKRKPTESSYLFIFDDFFVVFSKICSEKWSILLTVKSYITIITPWRQRILIAHKTLWPKPILGPWYTHKCVYNRGLYALSFRPSAIAIQYIIWSSSDIIS